MARFPHRLVAAALAVAALLALAMALTEGINPRPDVWAGPPDEHNHRSAARYYVEHWLPPRVGDPASLESYSRDYGYSYINDPDLVYFFAGKFAKLVSPAVANADLAFRLFNVTLLALLALACLRRADDWPIFLPLLLTPQAWYIFSYFNSDGFPLFLSVLLAQQVASPRSGFNRYLDTPGAARGLAGALAFCALAGLLLLSKKNYYAFLALLPAAVALARLGKASALVTAAAAILAATVFLGWLAPAPALKWTVAAALGAAVLAAAFRDPATRRARAAALAKLAILGTIAVAFMLPRHAWDIALHGSLQDKYVAQGQLQEKIAKPEYKPSQVYRGEDPKATYYGLELRKRGTTLAEIFGPFWSWHTRTFSTATGSYGWTQFNSPKPYAVLLAAAYLGLMGLYAFAVARSREGAAAIGFGLVAAFAALTVAVSVHHSWVNDFQAQGRYLFPALAMAGIGLMQVRQWLPLAPLAGIVGACFALSAYSFVFVGLVSVQKSF